MSRKFGADADRLNLMSVKDESMAQWELSFRWREWAWRFAHNFHRAHHNTTNEALTRPMKIRQRDGMAVQMKRSEISPFHHQLIR